VIRDCKKYLDTNTTQSKAEVIATLNLFYEITDNLLEEENRPARWFQ